MSSDVSRVIVPGSSLRTRHVTAVTAGNALEFYDFLTYSFFALQIGRTFFPSQNPLSSLLLSLATFGAGFLTRPIGALMIGRMADRAGRKSAMTVTFLLMGIAIIGIALTPAYGSIGIAAPILVVAWRLLQGFALGGEVGSSTAFLVETAPVAHRGVYGSLQNVSQGAATFFAGVIGFGLSSVLDAGALDSWGWRCAFLVGASVVPIGLVIRRSLPETLHSPDIPSTWRPADAGSSTRVAWLGLVMITSNTMMTYVRAYLTTYAVGTLGMSSQVAFVTTMINGLGSAASFLLGAWLSDRVGRKPVMIGFTLLAAVCAMPVFLTIVHWRTPAALYMATAVLTVVTGIGQGPLLTAIAEALPRDVRARMLGTIYAVAVAVFGGSTQFIVAWLIGTTGSPLVPGWYTVGAALVGLAAMIATRESAPAISDGKRTSSASPPAAEALSDTAAP